ncbi:hypothetical protein CYMTET_46744 [Cymbomonas tetramitiformis]|uniref:Reverse transcriptase domain-containing protein n=1 Tax=Cymbomonas tetramitiformis TaxID=36881 RepID=A0AAE0BVJ1_9CHLO|nr:hypothetical protein CYMTET_46744 [Cymbomonas tetramitiformis]
MTSGETASDVGAVGGVEEWLEFMSVVVYVADVWADRKEAEGEKFPEVAAWAQALLALIGPASTGASRGSTAGGAGASGSGGAAASAAAPSASVPSLTTSALAAAVAPHAIAAAIAVAMGEKLDAFGERLRVLEAQGSAAEGAGLHGGGATSAVGVPLQNAIRDSIATVEGWDISRCSQASTDLVYEAARLRPQLRLLRAVHSFGKAPIKSLEAHAFDPLVHVLPELREEECELDELPAGREATVEHWRAFVHLLQGRVGKFQRFVKSQVPSFVISDVMVASFFKKRKQVTFEGEEEEARAAGAGHESLPPLDASRKDRLAALGAGFQTVNEEQLAGAFEESWLRKTSLDPQLTVVPKKKKCKDFDEWERVFLRILCEAPVETRDDLPDFKAWAKTIAAEFSFYHFNEFYEHLVRQVQRSTTGISLDRCDRVWRVYRQQHSLHEKGAKVKAPRGRYTWRRDAQKQLRPAAPEDTGGGRGKGKGAGGRGTKGRHGGGRGRGGKRLIPVVVVPLGEPKSSNGAPAAADEVPVVAPDPMVEADAALVVGQPIAVEAVGAVDAQEGCGPPEVEDGGDVSLGQPGGADGPGRWWADLRADQFIPVWDVLGGGRRHDRAPMVWEFERLAPLPVTQLSPDTWASPLEPWRTRVSTRWPELRADILRRATVETMERCGTSEGERRCYVEECVRVGCAVPTLTRHAHIVAAAFNGWHDVDFLVRCAACGAGWPSEKIDIDEPHRVPNYVGPEHIEVMRDELRREHDVGHIFLATWRLPLGVIALGMVEKVRKGKVKYRPVSDYSRPADVGVNARIELEHDEFTTVKEAYGMLRPGHWIVKVDLEAAYRSVGIASQFWPHLCFEFDDVRWMDARAPFGNRALPGIFMRWTRAVVAWMRARGIPSVGYLDDFFCVLETKEEAEEAMMLLVEFVTFLGFKVNSAKCEGPEQVLEFLGVLIDTSGEVCIASIDEERIAVVVQKVGALRAQAARRMVARRALKSLLGLLAFCSHVVWGLSLYTRRGFDFLAATMGRRMVRLPRQVLDDLAVLKQVVRQYNGGRTVLERRFVDERHFATDASSTLRMSGRTVVVRIDNQSAMHQVGSWWGPVVYLTLLRQIFDMPQFLTEQKAFLRADIWRQDQDDWMVCPVRWAALDQELGPFTVNSCVAVSRANSYCYHSWSAVEESRELQREAERYRAEALAPETRRCYGTGVRAFVTFCISFACLECLESLLPATDRTLCMFITYCSWFVQPDTVKNYLAGVRQLHLQWGHEWVPVAARHAVAATLQGVKRCWGRPPKPVMPLTLADLAKMALLISAHDLGQEALWVAIFVGFFGLFRKDNLTTGKAGAWNTRRALLRDDALFHEDGSVVWIRVQYSKAIQCGERHHWVPLRALPGSLLCPVRALMRLMERTAGRLGDSALFVMEKVTGRRAAVAPMTHDAMVAGIKSLAERVGLNPSSYPYAGHSLRRGGATVAMRLDVASI